MYFSEMGGPFNQVSLVRVLYVHMSLSTVSLCCFLQVHNQEESCLQRIALTKQMKSGEELTNVFLSPFAMFLIGLANVYFYLFSLSVKLSVPVPNFGNIESQSTLRFSRVALHVCIFEGNFFGGIYMHPEVSHTFGSERWIPIVIATVFLLKFQSCLLTSTRSSPGYFAIIHVANPRPAFQSMSFHS